MLIGSLFGLLCLIYTPVKTATNRNYFKDAFRLLQLLSLDVVVGALAMGLFAVKLLQVAPNKWWWPVLALSVWTIYTSDHLLDSLSRKDGAVIRRHKIHYLFRLPLFIALSISAILAVLLTSLFLNNTVVIVGLITGFFAVLYLGLVFFSRKQHYYFQKEFIISLFYVIGIWMYPVLLHGSFLSPFDWLVIVSMVLMVWYEGILVSVFEVEKDINDGHNSFAVRFGGNKSNLFLTLLFIIISILLLILFIMANSRINYFAILIEVVMVSSLYLLSRFPDFFKKHEYYKTIGELIFWLPGLLYFVG